MAVGSKARWQSIPMPQGPAVGYYTLWVNGGSPVLGQDPKGISFTFIYKRRDTQGQLGSSNSLLPPQKLCCLIISLMLSQSCSLVKYTKEVWSQERNLKSNYGNKQLSQEILPVGDQFGVWGILECQEVHLDLGVALVLIPASPVAQH